MQLTSLPPVLGDPVLLDSVVEEVVDEFVEEVGDEVVVDDCVVLSPPDGVVDVPLQFFT